MSQADLNILERDVEAARKRLAKDIDRMRNPAALSDFRNDVMAKASSLKDEFVRKASDTASGAAQRVWSDLKDRANANPGATLAIGAGLAWHLARHPPITTLLVGLGLISLMRTDPSSNPSPLVTRATELAETVRQKAQEWGEEARDVVGTVSDKARGWGEDAREVAGEMISEASNTASELTGHHIFPDSAARDTYLLGAAALAIGAATVIAFQRKDD